MNRSSVDTSITQSKILENERRIADPDYPAEQKAALRAQIANDKISLEKEMTVKPISQNPVPANAMPTAMPSVSVAPGMSMPSIGASKMFNSPETLKKIAELLSKAESGKPVEDVMEEIRKETGLSTEAFWMEMGKISMSEENPFANNDESDDSDDDSDDKSGLPEKEKESDGDSDSDDEEVEADHDDAKEEDKKEDKKDKKEDKKEEKKHEKADKKMGELLEKMIDIGEELIDVEGDEEGEAHVSDIIQAIKILKEFQSEEKGEHSGGMELEKIGPDIPPMMEGLAVPLSDGEHMEGNDMLGDGPKEVEMYPDMGLNKPDEIKVIDMAPAAKPLIAASLEAEAKASPEAKEFISGKMSKMKKEKGKGKKFAPKQEIAIALSEARGEGYDIPKSKKEAGKMPPWLDKGKGKKDDKDKDKDKKDDKNPFGKDKKDKKSNILNINDRVWRKSDYESGFETVGDEPGRIVAFGNEKAVVDWGHEDGIPTEEIPAELILAESGENGELFAASLESGHSEEHFVSAGSTMGQAESVEHVLRETSLHDILAKQYLESKPKEGTVKHIASGKVCKVLQRLANGQLKVAVDDSEITLWEFEVE